MDLKMRKAAWLGCVIGGFAVLLLIGAAWTGRRSPTSALPTDQRLAQDNPGAPPGPTLEQLAQEALNNSQLAPGSGKHDFDAQTAVQLAVTPFVPGETFRMPDYSAQVRFLTPDDTDCIGGHGPSHRFFVYKKDGAISAGIVCENANEEWYVMDLNLVKEGSGLRTPGD